jgi:mono/diheme cytochrome c family protein
VIKLIFIAAILALAAPIVVLTYWGRTMPRMRHQPNIRAYETVMRLPPLGSVPISRPEAAPALSTAAAGRLYYRYYCVFCHGENGDGNGPVGQSYVPKPTDLRRAKIQSYSDDDLRQAMLTGKGHAPVLESIIPRAYYGALVAYVRSLGRTEASSPP